MSVPRSKIELVEPLPVLPDHPDPDYSRHEAYTRHGAHGGAILQDRWRQPEGFILCSSLGVLFDIPTDDCIGKSPGSASRHNRFTMNNQSSVFSFPVIN